MHLLKSVLPKKESYLKTGSVDYEPTMQEHTKASTATSAIVGDGLVDKSHPYQYTYCVRYSRVGHENTVTCTSHRTETRYKAPPDSSLISQLKAKYESYKCPSGVIPASHMGGVHRKRH